MKVLWCSILPFPPLCRHLNMDMSVFGGWLFSSASMLLEESDMQIGVIVPSPDRCYREVSTEGIDYYLIPTCGVTKLDNKMINYCKEAIMSFCPDLIHLQGTEYSLAAATFLASSGVPIVASIQGLAGPYTRYSDGYLNFCDKMFNLTLIDILRGSTLLGIERNFKKRARLENLIVRNIPNIIGRTKWDYAHAKAMNFDINYFVCNESLRDSFYGAQKWNYESCEKHTIFVSNCDVPLKGAHIVLKSLAIIKRYYPDVMIKFVGLNALSKNWKERLHFTGYQKYLKKIIKNLKLENNVVFLGRLSEHEMKDHFLKANVFVLPSAIENSPNSLCEAQILGVPCVAAYIGGTPDFIENGITGYLYRFEEYEMLAQIIVNIFTENDYRFSSNAIKVAEKRNNKKDNVCQLISIYNKILKTNGIM